MIVKSIDGTSYTLRDWINNQEFSLMAEAQMIMMKASGEICKWDQTRMKNLDTLSKDGSPNKDKVALTKYIVEHDIITKYTQIKSKAAQSLITSPPFDDYNTLPRDIVSAAESLVERLFIEAQPLPNESESKK